MHKMLTISLFFLAAFLCGQGDVTTAQSVKEGEFFDLHHEQLVCNHRYNIDAERTSSVVVPSVRTTLNTAPRYQQNRTSQNAIVGRSITTSNYLVSRFIHRLGTCARAVDFYLYTFCQLRL